MKKAENFFSAEEKKLIISAIQAAEMNTSGEIRVHLENFCKGDVLDRAAFLFARLKMHKTAKRNGVLFYMAVRDQKFAILGDAGINALTPEDFWDEIKEAMAGSFRDAKFAEGLARGVNMAGQALKKHFPYREDDVNELSDDLSFGNN